MSIWEAVLAREVLKLPEYSSARDAANMQARIDSAGPEFETLRRLVNGPSDDGRFLIDTVDA